MCATITKQYDNLIKIIKDGPIHYDLERKEEFKIKSLLLLKKISEDLNLKAVTIYFNPGGVAVSGEANLMGMWQEGNGIYVNLSDDTFMLRTIQNMNDYRSGSNNFIYSSWNSNYDYSYKYVLDKLLKLKINN